MSSASSDNENLDPLSMRFPALVPTAPCTRSLPEPLPASPGSFSHVETLPTQIDEDDIPVIDRPPSPIPTPQQWKKRDHKEAMVLLNMADGTPLPLPARIGRAPRNPQSVPKYWMELSFLNLLDPHLAHQSVLNTCRSLDGKQFESTNMRCFDVQCGSRVHHPNIHAIYRTPEKFLDSVGTVAPQLYLSSYDNIRVVADRHYLSVETQYVSPYVDESWILQNEVVGW
ncbi:hypothetical protein HOY80DRAFT_1080248 [Tuber brumale]|nr:hypothetical protein HOY80DRAFT_1080248 [Tuber brumale]